MQISSTFSPDTFYAMNHIPFQFKPHMKYIRAHMQPTTCHFFIYLSEMLIDLIPLRNIENCNKFIFIIVHQFQCNEMNKQTNK